MPAVAGMTVGNREMTSGDMIGASPGAMQSASLGGGQPANLADILERVLDKGLVIAGDIRVNLLDIELLTIKLRLVIASLDTARQVGINWWESDPWLNAGAANGSGARNPTGGHELPGRGGHELSGRGQHLDRELGDLEDENRRLRDRVRELESDARPEAGRRSRD
jgi:Gas vesicle protein